MTKPPTNTSKPRRKKLIEVALPLRAINDESSRRKRKAPKGYPSTFHWWYAQRPAAACRAVLFASFVDDPDDDPELANRPDKADAAADRRAKLFDIIEDLILWENTGKLAVINRARAEIARSVATQNVLDGKHKRYEPLADCGDVEPDNLIRLSAKPEQVNAYLATHAPPVLDPFAGGGSIPLEAQRLGLRTHASDLNPVAVLINKALIEIPPKFAGKPPVHPKADQQSHWPGATGLAEDVRRYAKWMSDEAEKRIGHLYPKVAVTEAMASNRPDLRPYVGQKLVVVAWLWCRTVKCPNPGCGRSMPMARSFSLSTKKGKRAYVDPIVDKSSGTIRFTVKHEGQPIDETTNRSMARCLYCDNVMKKPQLREQAEKHGMGQTPFAVVVEGQRGRIYLEATPDLVPQASKPDAPEIDQLMTDDKRWFSPPQYGLPSFRDLFTSRQLTALLTFSDSVGEARAKVKSDAEAAGHLPNDPRPLDEGGEGPQAYADAVATYLGCVLSRVADYGSTLASWRPKDNAMRSTIGKQALPMVWDFAEANPFGRSSSGLVEAAKVVSNALEMVPAGPGATVKQRDAASSAQAVRGCACTDPPYYDNVGYADLSDFFYVWLRRTLREVMPQLGETLLTPKSDEIIASPYRHPGGKAEAKAFFEQRLGEAFRSLREGCDPNFPTTIFYAFKQSETGDAGEASTGWETFLNAVIRQGYTINGTWPMRTEGDNRQVGIGANALASSILLVCRPLQSDAKVATRGELVAALHEELPPAVRQMQAGSIAPVDLAQASIGPGMAIFSRYARVENADGSTMTTRAALELINATLDDTLAEQDADFDIDTRWAIKWFEQYGMNEGPFGDANTLANAFAIGVDGLRSAGIVKSGHSKVSLLKRSDLPADWNPQADKRLTVWEATQHLIRRLEDKGEVGAASLLAALGNTVGESAKELSYRLFRLCDRTKRAKEAASYDALVKSWPEIVRLSRDADIVRESQSEMFQH